MIGIETLAASTNPLVQLVAPDRTSHGEMDCDLRRVGFTLYLDYNTATVMISDEWRNNVRGIPTNSYLVGASFDPKNIASSEPVDQKVILFRVGERVMIDHDHEHRRAIEQYFAQNPGSASGHMTQLDPITMSKMQLSGVSCRILGTFYVDPDGKGDELTFGADIEDVFASRALRVYKPSRAALDKIVNYVDPMRLAQMRQEAKEAGVGTPVPFQIGAVRFASTRHMQRLETEPEVPVCISPADFLARRTGVFGMTRTGKSNTTKTMVSEVAITAHITHQPIGQLIFDINGEYSNANGQDAGSAINDVFSDNTVRYRALEAEGFRDLRSNFYDDLPIGLEIIREGFESKKISTSSDDMKTFLNFEVPERIEGDYGHNGRRDIKISILRSILFNAEYAPDRRNMEKQTIPLGKSILATIVKESVRLNLDVDGIPAARAGDDEAAAANRARVDAMKEDDLASTGMATFKMYAEGKNGKISAPLDEMTRFWKRVRTIEKANNAYNDEEKGLKNTKGKPYLTTEDRSLLNVLVGLNRNDNPIVAGNAIRNAGREFHGTNGSGQLAQDVYNLLAEGRIVILDLSVGSPKVREGLAKKLASGLFHESAGRFNANQRPPRIVVYVEEAHNLIGKSAELTEIWPRVAKEGAKYGIALVYATQEPSSVHPNILANTENFFVTHLNNDSEIKALSSYYDFGDFGPSLKRVQDIGFARIKTLSAQFVTPTQIRKFSPDEVKARYAEAKSKNADLNAWFTPLKES